MNKQAYLAALRRTLSGLPREQIDDIARDYEQHFADAAMNGRNENDTCRALGDPRKLGLELKAVTHFAAFQRRHSLLNLARLAAVLLGLGAFNIFVLPVMLIAPLLLMAFYLCSASCFVGGAVLVASGLFSTDKIMFDHGDRRSALVLVGQTDRVLSAQNGSGFQVSPYAIGYIEEPSTGQRIEAIGETPSGENIKTVIGAAYLLCGYALYIFSRKLTRYAGKIIPRYLAANGKIVGSTIK